jgi:hypothetical protein
LSRYCKNNQKGYLDTCQERKDVPCRARTGYIDQTLPVLFEPDENTQLSTSLELHETLTSVKKGTKAILQITVHNTTSHDILLRNRTALGRLQLIKSATPIEVKLRQTTENGQNRSVPEKAATKEKTPEPIRNNKRGNM